MAANINRKLNRHQHTDQRVQKQTQFMTKITQSEVRNCNSTYNRERMVFITGYPCGIKRILISTLPLHQKEFQIVP